MGACRSFTEHAHQYTTLKNLILKRSLFFAMNLYFISQSCRSVKQYVSFKRQFCQDTFFCSTCNDFEVMLHLFTKDIVKNLKTKNSLKIEHNYNIMLIFKHIANSFGILGAYSGILKKRSVKINKLILYFYSNIKGQNGKTYRTQKSAVSASSRKCVF